MKIWRLTETSFSPTGNVKVFRITTKNKIFCIGFLIQLQISCYDMAGQLPVLRSTRGLGTKPHCHIKHVRCKMVKKHQTFPYKTSMGKGFHAPPLLAYLRLQWGWRYPSLTCTYKCLFQQDLLAQALGCLLCCKQCKAFPKSCIF